MKKNLLYQTLFQLLATVLPLITTPYVARVLGVHNIGVYTYAATLVDYFAVFAMFGFTSYGCKTISAAKGNIDNLSRAYYSIRKLQTLLTTVALLVYYLFVCIAIRGDYALYLIESLWIINCYMDINWLFFGLEEFKLTVTRNLIIKVVTVAGLFLLVRSEEDLLIYAFILVIGTTVSNYFLMTQVRKWIPTRCKITMAEAVQHLKPAFLLFVPILAMTLYIRMDKTMLGLLSTYEEVGYYSNADKVINIPLGLITGLGTVSMPKIVTLLTNGKIEEFINIVKKSFTLVMIGCSAMAFGIMGVAEEFVPVFFGEGYDACVKLISALSFVIYFKAISTIMVNQILIPHNMERAYLIAVILGAGINFICNAVLIGTNGALGAVMATIFAELVVCGIEVYLLRNRFPVIRCLKDNLIYVLFGGVMFAGVRLVANISLFNSTICNLCAEVIVGGIIFTAECLIYWYIKSDSIYSDICSLIKRKH